MKFVDGCIIMVCVCACVGSILSPIRTQVIDVLHTICPILWMIIIITDLMCACAACACARLQESTKPDILTSDKLKWLTHGDHFLKNEAGADTALLGRVAAQTGDAPRSASNSIGV